MFWFCLISWLCTHELQSNLYLSTNILFLLLIIIIYWISGRSENEPCNNCAVFGNICVLPFECEYKVQNNLVAKLNRY